MAADKGSGKSERSKPGAARKSGPIEDGLELWYQIAKTVKPLARNLDAAKTPTKPAQPNADSAVRKPAASKPAKVICSPIAPLQPQRRDGPLVTGSLEGVDGRTAGRLKRGKLRVEARLDLHGMTQVQAERALSRFLTDAQTAGLRNVLLITGKGRSGMESGNGVLRRELPRWLNLPQNRDRVVAVTQAQPKDGGSGAFYVRLRRIR